MKLDNGLASNILAELQENKMEHATRNKYCKVQTSIKPARWHWKTETATFSFCILCKSISVFNISIS